MTVSHMLCKFDGGYREVAATFSTTCRVEAYMELGGVTETTAVDTIARRALDAMRGAETSVTLDMEPTAIADTPYYSFGVGDYITVPDENDVPTQYRVVGLTMSEDDEGNPIFVPELATLRQSRVDEQDRWLKRMQNGALGGSNEAVSPVRVKGVVDIKEINTTEFPPFSYSGIVAVSESPPYSPSRNVVVTRLMVSALLPGTGVTTVEVRLNGVAFGTADLDPAQLRGYDYLINTPVNTTDVVTVAITTAGGHTNVTVQLGIVEM